MKAWHFATALMISAPLLLTACSSDSPTPAAAGQADTSLARVQKAGKLVICSSNDLPYFYTDPKTKKLSGTDYDMDKAIAAELGIKKIEIFEVPISTIIPALTSKRCDLISDNIAITAKRSEQVAFSAPMYRAGQALVVPKGNPAGINSVDDFPGHSVGSYLGTVQLDYLKSLAAKDPRIQVKEYKSIPEILADLKAGRLDAAAFDDMVAGYSLKANPALPIEVINYKLPIGDYAVGAAFRKQDHALRNAFNDANRKLMFDGTIGKVLSTWGLTPIERYAAFPNCCNAPN
jgi:polar amino acid transport system substrate-binding protein